MSEGIYSGEDAVVYLIPIETEPSIQVDDGEFTCVWKNNQTLNR